MNTMPHNIATRPRERGMALLMVLMAVGVASIIGMTLLYTASLRAQVSGNLGRTMQVRALADSGINIALNYLRYPNDAPVEFPGVYQLDLSLDEPVRLLISVAELSSTHKTYRITSTAQIPPGGDGLSHTAVADVKVHEANRNLYGLAHNGSLVLPLNLRVNGDARVDDAVTLLSAFGNVTRVTGTLYTGGSVSGSVLPVILPIPKRPASAAPAFNDLTLINGQSRSNFTYRLPGDTTLYTAQKISGSSLPPLAFGAPAATNPANVWWSDSNVRLEGVDFSGTLVIWPTATSARRLEVRSGNNTIRSISKLPAIIVRDQIQMFSTAGLTVHGVAYAGKGISSNITSLGPLTVNGALLLGEPSAAIATTHLGQVTVNYDPEKVDVPDLAVTGKVPVSIKVLAWEN